MSAEISCATAARIKYSPSPVHDTAQVALFAYVPAPMMGESPIRPAFLLLVPPVEVAAARLLLMVLDELRTDGLVVHQVRLEMDG